MHRKTAFVGIAALILGSIPAQAGERVAFDRAQMNDPDYVTALLEKIEDAAFSECQDLLAGSVYYHRLMKTCVKASVAAALEEIGEPTLSDFAQAGRNSDAAG